MIRFPCLFEGDEVLSRLCAFLLLDFAGNDVIEGREGTFDVTLYLGFWCLFANFRCDRRVAGLKALASYVMHLFWSFKWV